MLVAPAQTAPAFLARVAKLLTTNQYATAYRSLNSADRARVPLGVYVRCSLTQPISARLVSVHILRSWSERVLVIPGRHMRPSVATRLAITVHAPGLKHDVRGVVTRHAILERGHWTWMLPPTRLAFFVNDVSCDRAVSGSL